MMSEDRRVHEPTEPLDSPFDGLFGDTAELRVLQEIVADPYSDYTQKELMELTGLSDPSVRKGLAVLLEHGIIRNVSSVRRRPLYRASLDSRKLTTLTFLSYAVLDERTGSAAMDDAVKHYCESIPTKVEVVLAEGSTFNRYEMPRYERALSANEGSDTVIQEA